MQLHRQIIPLLKIALVAFSAVYLVACTSLGGAQVKHDRIEYNEAMAESGSAQELMNIVRLHYQGMDEFIDVTTLTSENSMAASLGSTLTGPLHDLFGHGASLGISPFASYSDRPKAVYAEASGKEYMQSFLAHLSMRGLFILVNGGWPMSHVFHLAVQRIGDVVNFENDAYAKQRGNKRFNDFVQLTKVFDKIMAQGNAEIKLLEVNDKDKEFEIDMHWHNHIHFTAHERHLLRLAGVNPSTSEIIFSSDHVFSVKKVNTVYVETRSGENTIYYLSTFIKPIDGVHHGKNFYAVGKDFFRIEVSYNKPKNAYAEIKYRNFWYYVPQSDLASTGTLTLLNGMLQIQRSGTTGIEQTVAVNV